MNIKLHRIAVFLCLLCGITNLVLIGLMGIIIKHFQFTIPSVIVHYRVYWVLGILLFVACFVWGLVLGIIGTIGNWGGQSRWFLISLGITLIPVVLFLWVFFCHG